MYAYAAAGVTTGSAAGGAQSMQDDSRFALSRAARANAFAVAGHWKLTQFGQKN